MGCHSSKLEERISGDIAPSDVVMKEVGTVSLLHHKNASVHVSVGVRSAALVLTKTQVWFTNVTMPDKTWNIPLERVVGVDFAKYKSGPKNNNSKNKALVIDFNDMDTGMAVREGKIFYGHCVDVLYPIIHTGIVGFFFFEKVYYDSFCPKERFELSYLR